MKTDYKYIRFEKLEDKPHHVEGVRWSSTVRTPAA